MWGWVAQDAVLSVGSVITWVGTITCSDRANMATQLAAGGLESDHMLKVAVNHLFPAEWAYYPRARDILI